MSLKKTLVLISLSLLSFTTAIAAATWPTSSSGTNIASGVGSYNSGFEASGLSYHDLYGYLVVGDDGDVAILDGTGSILDYAYLGGDFEGITVADHSSDYAYIASENRNSILEIDLSTLTLTGSEWDLDLTQSGGYGFEAIAFVPAANAPSSWGTPSYNGFFIGGSQADTSVHVYDIDTRSSGTSTYSSLASISTPYQDTAGLHYSPETELLYVLHDSANKMKEYDLAGNIISSYYTPTSAAEEGIYIETDCANATGTIGFSDDGGPTVNLYTNYPITCDADGDGTPTHLDCDDDDASIQNEIEYYLDSDGDRLGDPSNSTSVCSHSVPTGYAPNNKDAADNISNWGVEISGDGIDNDGVDTDGDWAPDGDGQIDEVNTIGENGAHPHYSTLDPNSNMHRFTITNITVNSFNAAVTVEFRDGSKYKYKPFSTTSFRGSTSYIRFGNTAYIGLTHGKKSKKVNLLDGS